MNRISIKDAVVEHEEQCQGRENERTEKFGEENEKFVEGKPTQGEVVLRVYATRERARNGQGGTQARQTRRETHRGIDKLKLKIKAFLLQIVDREAGKEVALDTRSTVYTRGRCPAALTCSLSRITAVWSKKHQ